MSEKLTCPECDSTNIKTEKNWETTNLPFGKTVKHEKTIHVCNECGEKGSFTRQLIEENHAVYYSSLKECNKLLVEDISNYLSGHGVAMAHVERSLGLAQRTLSRWKTQGISASGMALMRIIRTYPWILNVADENFDEQYANAEIIRQAGVVISKHIPPSEVDISASEDSISLSVLWTKTGVAIVDSPEDGPEVTISSKPTQSISV